MRDWAVRRSRSTHQQLRRAPLGPSDSPFVVHSPPPAAAAAATPQQIHAVCPKHHDVPGSLAEHHDAPERAWPVVGNNLSRVMSITATAFTKASEAVFHLP
jgi:hypothetical protein